MSALFCFFHLSAWRKWSATVLLFSRLTGNTHAYSLSHKLTNVRCTSQFVPPLWNLMNDIPISITAPLCASGLCSVASYVFHQPLKPNLLRYLLWSQSGRNHKKSIRKYKKPLISELVGNIYVCNEYLACRL